MKYQNYPNRLADVFDDTYFGVYADYVAQINQALDEDSFQKLKELLVIIKTKGSKHSFDEGYEMGFKDGEGEREANDNEMYNQGYDEGYRDGQKDAS